MTRDREIERVLDHWFQDGPSVIPERVLHVAFDRVDRTPQRRFAALLARSLPMPPMFRAGVLAAAVLVAVVAGITVLNPNRGPGTSPTPSPSPSSSSPAGTVVPAALVGRWMGGPRAVPGIRAGSGTTILLTTDSFVMTQSNQGDQELLRSSASSQDASTVRLELGTPSAGCSAGDVALFRWRLSPGGRVLTLQGYSEDCATRGDAVPGTWWKMDCPAEGDFCLGDLEAGTYASQYFDPFVRAGGSWAARYGVVSYTVPDGWANVEDWPEKLVLAPTDAPDETAIYLFSNVVAVSESDPCQELPAEGVGETAADLAAWVASAPGVVATPPVSIRLGGLDAWRLDVSMDPAWTATCPFSGGQPTRMLFIDRPGTGDFYWGLARETRMRLYLVELGDGRAMLISAETNQAEGADVFLAEASSIVESFDFQE